MSVLNKITRSASETPYQKALKSVNEIVKDRVAHGIDAETTSSLIGLESGKLSDHAMSGLVDTNTRVTDLLRGTSMFEQLLADATAEQQEAALEAASMTIMALGDAEGYFNALGAKGNVTGKELEQNMNYSTTADELTDLDTALEGFDPSALEEYASHAVVANVLASLRTPFEEAFFPLINVAAGEGGVTVPVNIPRIYKPMTRNSDGSPDNFNRVSLIRAISDSSILANNALDVIPVASDEVNLPAILVTDADVATKDATVDGFTFRTRPYKFNTEFSLLGSASYASLGANLDETDQLEPNFKMGTIWVKVARDGEEAVYAFNVDRQPGTLLQQSAEGDDTAYIANSQVKFYLDDKKAPHTGTATALIGKLNTDISGSSATAALKMVISARISMSINSDDSNCFASFGDVKIVSAVNDSGEEKVGDTSDVVVTLLGFVPTVRRTNSNLRSRSNIVDSRIVTNYRFKTRMQSPIISQHGVGAPVNTSVEGLAHTLRIHSCNNAHRTLLSAREMIREEHGDRESRSTIGSEVVVPTYKYQRIVLEDAVTTMNSRDNDDNLRGALTSAVANMVNFLLTESEYLAGLQFFYGNINNYEAIVVTDPVIYSYLMISGDPRTLGNGRNFVVTQTLDKDFTGKIFISVRRSQRDGKMHPLDFGAYLNTPSLSWNVQTTRGNRVVNEIHMMPVSAAHVTCPILGELDVEGLENFYAEAGE